MRGVPITSELERILALPRRDPNGGPTLPQLTRLLTDALKTPQGTMTLKPIQAFALSEIYDNRGLLGPIGVGSGKALISLLAPVVRQKFKPVLFVPAALKIQTEQQVIPAMSRHFRLHRNLRIESYNFLSSPKSTDFLEQYEPDMIILDEAHALKRHDASRTKRFLRYMKAHPECELVALSGTMTQKSLFDFYELCKLALPGVRCPMPLTYPVLKDWDAAIGAGADWARDEPMEPGALEMLCGLLPNGERETVRQGFRRRLVETPGVVATSESAIGTSLIISASRPQVPPAITKALKDLRRDWVTAWGETVESGPILAQHAKQLAMGFYYRWCWPNNEPDVEWLYARSMWHRELRHYLKRNIKGMDSPFLIGAAIKDGRVQSEAYAPWVAVRDRWKPSPPVETVWLDDFLIREILAWMSDHPKGIVWYEHKAVGARLAQLGVQVFGGGTDAAILKAKGPMACSVEAHHTGKNLQAWCDNLIVSPTGNAAKLQQLLARTHRPGQDADEVRADVFVHTAELDESWAKAVQTADYLQNVTGDPQKVLMATHLGFDALLKAA